MGIAGFFCKYPCRILCNKVYCDRLVRMFKDIAFWYGEKVQSIRLDVNSSKGSSEEVSKALDVSLSHIDTYRFNGKIKFFLYIQ